MPVVGNMVHVMVGDLGIALHTAKTPSQAEWAAWMESIRAVPSARLRVLALTDGGGPNTVQRSEFVKYLAGAKTRIAVVSDALVVRGIVTALSWFTNGIRIFVPEQFHEAVAHLDLTKAEREEVKERVQQMARSLELVRAMRGI
ncbi:MAG TPA: hypothetical protein VGH87_24430 [Polyangiaceae bacterium]|nr:hypothetical protein [Polyangiaceae bacterium]